MDTERGIFTHCMGGWRAPLCVLDNLVPHHELPPEPDDPPEASPCMEGDSGFRWACRLHHWVGHVGYDDEGEPIGVIPTLRRRSSQ
jgi:hypothetical protein